MDFSDALLSIRNDPTNVGIRRRDWKSGRVIVLAKHVGGKAFRLLDESEDTVLDWDWKPGSREMLAIDWETIRRRQGRLKTYRLRKSVIDSYLRNLRTSLEFRRIEIHDPDEIVNIEGIQPFKMVTLPGDWEEDKKK